MSEEQRPPADPPSEDSTPLDHIVDDSEKRAECREWIHREFSEGRGADDILAELIGNGWPTEDAETMRGDERHGIFAASSPGMKSPAPPRVGIARP